MSSYYANIDHEEGAHACFIHRKKKWVPSLLLKKLSLPVHNSNSFHIGSTIYQQIKETATEKIGFPEKIGFQHFIWLRSINDVIFI